MDNDTISSPQSLNISPTSPTSPNLCQRCLDRTFYCGKGCGKCMTGCVCFPVFACGSFLLGLGKTILGCVRCDCSDDFFKDRERVCRGCGVGTAVSISTQMMLSGMADMFTTPIHHTPPVVALSPTHSEIKNIKI